MDLVIAFFTFLPAHFWDALNLIFTDPIGLGLIIKIIFYGVLTAVQYMLIFRGIVRLFDRMFY